MHPPRSYGALNWDGMDVDEDGAKDRGAGSCNATRIEGDAVTLGVSRNNARDMCSHGEHHSYTRSIRGNRYLDLFP